LQHHLDQIGAQFNQGPDIGLPLCCLTNDSEIDVVSGIPQGTTFFVRTADSDGIEAVLNVFTQLAHHDPAELAERLLRKLAEEGKA